jgi:hypothetical protein
VAQLPVFFANSNNLVRIYEKILDISTKKWGKHHFDANIDAGISFFRPFWLKVDSRMMDDVRE